MPPQVFGSLSSPLGVSASRFGAPPAPPPLPCPTHLLLVLNNLFQTRPPVLPCPQCPPLSFPPPFNSEYFVSKHHPRPQSSSLLPSPLHPSQAFNWLIRWWVVTLNLFSSSNVFSRNSLPHPKETAIEAEFPNHNFNFQFTKYFCFKYVKFFLLKA